MVAGVEDKIGNLLPLMDELEGSTFNCTDLEDVEIPPADVAAILILTPLLVLAPSLTPSPGWLLLSVSPENGHNNIVALLNDVYLLHSKEISFTD